MPRLTRRVPSYCRHRASGQAVVTLSGQDFYLGPYGTQVSKREYDRVVAEWLARGRSALAAPEADQAVAGGVQIDGDGIGGGRSERQIGDIGRHKLDRPQAIDQWRMEPYCDPPCGGCRIDRLQI